jgi:hypothetical protein
VRRSGLRLAFLLQFRLFVSRAQARGHPQPDGSSCISFGIGAGRQGRSSFSAFGAALLLLSRSSRPLPPNYSVKWTAAAVLR